ncbi:MAG TPA: HAD hydrolase-like protein [Mucilaginibacter sp.]|nr:HAD hydrolase-like protein [Mucilaginibacter sp.]
MMTYTDIDKRKNAFIFELDNVLYPEKDYLFQVYYLFAGLLEYTTQIDAKQTTDTMINTYMERGKEFAFDGIKEKLEVEEKYRSSLKHLMLTAKLPLKLLLYRNILTLLQDIVVDRKKIFIVTNGNPEMQLNKIKQMEWNGLEQYLTVYFTDEIKPKPDTDVIDVLIRDHNLQRREMIMIENSEIDRLCAESSGIDYLNVSDFLNTEL